ncbi:hypothetical protein DRW41_00105 [Neobacillus piezotolerans]|uniref:Uncharacterized protein n=1 Tax=Neobacillus piezotolerans TaxID=2259171 RepID=A0A3D8GUD5_9BACI|nr:hypothetical protein [Neobacillus piezotolerans]RDU38017.1 hypothetical protein DRW41_00105 [Neobacillus piezotolerans]
MIIEGSIISGEFDPSMNEFSLHKVKNLNTQSVLKENQLTAIYNYLKKHENDDDGQIITLNDQMPIRLTREELLKLAADFKKILSMYD